MLSACASTGHSEITRRSAICGRTPASDMQPTDGLTVQIVRARDRPPSAGLRIPPGSAFNACANRRTVARRGMVFLPTLQVADGVHEWTR